MTKGRPLRLILSFALPLLLGNLLQQTYSLTDTAIVGRFLGPSALAAVGATSSVQFLVLGFAIGTCSGLGIPMAREFGANHLSGLRRNIYNAMFLMGGSALVLTAVSLFMTDQILRVLNIPPEIYTDTKAYISLIFLGIPATLLYNFSATVLRSIGDSKAPFAFLAMSAFLNILLDLFCVSVLKTGCAGTAAATAVSQAVSGAAGTFYIIKRYPLLHFEKNEKQLQPSLIRDLALMAYPMGLQFSITAIGSMVMQAANNALGSIYVSAMTAAARIKQFAMCPFDAIGSAVSTFVSQNDGADKGRRARDGLIIGARISISYGILIGLILIFCGRGLSRLFVSREETAILDASAKLLVANGAFYWLLAILNVCRPTVQSLGHTGRAMFAGVLEMIARTLACVFFVPLYGFGAICFTDPLAWIGAAAFVAVTARRELDAAAARSDSKLAPLYEKIGVAMPR
ncbi:MAG: MATE family efflux transporter [Lachnospiraceae bacterium]|nr:MATE family efflux transporter [Lachnospiraceae bacterium]